MVFSNAKEKVNYFMHILMMELELDLLGDSDILQTLKYQEDEANTDNEIKTHIKYVLENKTMAQIQVKYSNTFVVKSEENIVELNYSDFGDIVLSRVYLSSEISDGIRQLIHLDKDVVYTNPDLLLEFRCGDLTIFESVEVKTTKTNVIPGSSVQQINPFGWVVFVKRSISSISVETGQYIYTINSKIPFPDRSPRPTISFNELAKWNKVNRLTSGKDLVYTKNLNDVSEKIDVLKNWRNTLALNWLNIIFPKTPKSTKEPWFNKVLGLFTIAFIEKYDSLNSIEKAEFQCSLKDRYLD